MLFFILFYVLFSFLFSFYLNVFFKRPPRAADAAQSIALIFDEQPTLPLLATVPLLLRASACGTCPCQAATFSIKFSQFSAAYSRATAYAINIMTNTSERDGKGDGKGDGDRDGGMVPFARHLYFNAYCICFFMAHLLEEGEGGGGRVGIQLPFAT